MARSFKSSGIQVNSSGSAAAAAIAPPTPPAGIKTPLTLGSSDIFVMNATLADQKKDDLKNLVLTNWGERLGLYDYGANLRPLLSELVSQDAEQENFESKMMDSIREATSKWMPYITLKTFTTNINHSQNGSGLAAIDMVITYDINGLNVKDAQLKLSMQAI